METPEDVDLGSDQADATATATATATASADTSARTGVIGAARAYRDRLTVTVGPAEPERRPWRRSLAVGWWVWVGSHALMLMATLVARLPRLTNPVDPGPKMIQPLHGLLLQWVTWDGGHYKIIATTGYGYPANTTAFYPFYPLMVRLVHLIVPGDVIYSMILVSNLAGLVALVLLHRFATYELGRDAGERTTFYLAAYPFAFFMCVGYTEALFLALALGALYCMRRGHWWTAGCLAACSSATRSTGVLLTAVMFVEYLRQRGFRPRQIRLNGLAVFLAPGGLVAFALYCWHKFGNPLQFSAVQAAWGRTFSMPWSTLWHGVASLNDRPILHPLHIYNAIDVICTVVGIVLLVLAVVGPWRLRPDQLYVVIFGWLNLLVILCSPIGGVLSMNSFARYLLTVIPIFMVLAKMGGNRHVERVYLLPAIGMQAIWALLFVNVLWAG